MNEVKEKLMWDCLHLLIRKLDDSGEDQEVEEILMRIETILEPSKEESESKDLKDEQAGYILEAGQKCQRCGHLEVELENLEWHKSQKCVKTEESA